MFTFPSSLPRCWVLVLLNNLFVAFTVSPTLAQEHPRHRISAGIYPLHAQIGGRNTYLLTTLAYDYRLRPQKNGFAVGAFATLTRSGEPSVNEWVVGPRITYQYQANKWGLYVGGGPGYGWRTGPEITPVGRLRLKYQAGVYYKVVRYAGLFGEVSNYRNFAGSRWGYWPTVGINAHF